MHLDFTSRVVLVTGVAQGIGLAIARGFKFLASEQAGWITGEVLSVNGGRS